MESRIDQFSINPADLPTMAEDKQRAEYSIALATFGLFATRESAAAARADRDNAILRYKTARYNQSRDIWIGFGDQVESIDKVREKFTLTRLQQSQLEGFKL